MLSRLARRPYRSASLPLSGLDGTHVRRVRLETRMGGPYSTSTDIPGRLWSLPGLGFDLWGVDKPKISVLISDLKELDTLRKWIQLEIRHHYIKSEAHQDSERQAYFVSEVESGGVCVCVCVCVFTWNRKGTMRGRGRVLKEGRRESKRGA